MQALATRTEKHIETWKTLSLPHFNSYSSFPDCENHLGYFFAASGRRGDPRGELWQDLQRGVRGCGALERRQRNDEGILRRRPPPSK